MTKDIFDKRLLERQKELKMKVNSPGRAAGTLIGLGFVFLIAFMTVGTLLGVWIKLFWIGWVFAP